MCNQLNRAVTTIDKLGTRTPVMTRVLQGVDTLPDEKATALLALTAHMPPGEAEEADVGSESVKS